MVSIFCIISRKWGSLSILSFPVYCLEIYFRRISYRRWMNYSLIILIKNKYYLIKYWMLEMNYMILMKDGN